MILTRVCDLRRKDDRLCHVPLVKLLQQTTLSVSKTNVVKLLLLSELNTEQYCEKNISGV